MLEVMCTRRYRDKNNVIIGYQLQADNGQTRTVGAHELKDAIRAKKLYVRNLKLTRDGKLKLSRYGRTECRTFDTTRKPVILDKDIIRELDEEDNSNSGETEKFEGNLLFKSNVDIDKYSGKLKLLGYKYKQLNNNLWMFTYKNKRVVMSPDSIKITDARELFSSTLFTSIDLKEVDLSEITSTEYMFYECYNLEKVDFPLHINAKIVKMDGMFFGCYKLKEFNIGEEFISRATTSVNEMFFGCSSLQNIDFTDFEDVDSNGKRMVYIRCDCYNLHDTSSMFDGCSSLESIKLGERFTTCSVKDMSHMFNDCENLQSLDLRNFDIHNVKDISGLFSGCKNLQSLDLRNFDTHNVEDMSGIFAGCKNLQSLDLRNFDTHNVENMSQMFLGCKNLQSLDLRNFDTHNVENMYGMFDGCEKLRSVDISNFNLENVKNVTGMFAECKSLKTIKIKEVNLGEIENNGAKLVFEDCKSFESVNLSRIKSATPISILGWFRGCENLKSVTLGRLKIADMRESFKDCKKLESVNMNNVYTYNLKSIQSAFEGCSSLRELNFKIRKTDDMAGLLKETRVLCNIRNAFKGCTSLEKLDITALNTQQVGSQAGTEYELDMGDKRYYYEGFVEGCDNLKYMKVSNKFTPLILLDIKDKVQRIDIEYPDGVTPLS